MNLSTLDEWLDWITTTHSVEIELGLDRIKQVAGRLGVLKPECPLIVVAGTNGKGSTVAGLEAIYLAAGYRVGAFTSPILFKHNEQVRINGQMARDADFCGAFLRVEAARGQVRLTAFEFFTLAAMLILKKHALDVWLLEVGLGGRLDAVNILDATVSVVTSIGMDHVALLGETREQIAIEKAGVMRKGQYVVCGEVAAPSTLYACANQVGARLVCVGKEFFYQQREGTWEFNALVPKKFKWVQLPLASLAIENMATVLMTVTLMQPSLPVMRAAIDQGLRQVSLPGRIQMVPLDVLEIYDVSHNPAAVQLLAQRLAALPCGGKTYAVFSMLADKDVKATIQAIHTEVDEWLVAPLGVKRGASLEALREAFECRGENNVTYLSGIKEAYSEAKARAKTGDRIVVFGSFHTMAMVWPHAEHERNGC